MYNSSIIPEVQISRTYEQTILKIDNEFSYEI